MPGKRTIPSSEDKIRITLAKFVSQARTMLAQTEPATVLEIWEILKAKEFDKTVPNLTQQQIRVLVKTEAQKLGASAIADPITSPPETPVDTTKPAPSDSAQPHLLPNSRHSQPPEKLSVKS